jgi:phospholipid/cholesterol/gamma-HCH transport system permease protein
MLESLGHMVMLSAQFLMALFTRKPEFSEWVKQAYEVGVKSVSIACITMLFTGMVLALQSAYALSKFGSDLFIADLVSISIVRELGPVLTALLVGGRVGSGMAAELGSMRVTQQIDALRSMASNPVYKLVVPRVVACVLCLPILTVLADFVGIVGGMLLSATQLHMNGYFFMARVASALVPLDFVSGIGKTFFFGFIIAMVSCSFGMRVEGGADGVGKATTQSVVLISIFVLVSDFFLTKFFYMLLGA